MTDQRKTKNQLLEDLERERARANLERDRSVALQEASNKLAGVHDTPEVLRLIIDEATRLVDAKAGYVRLVIDGKWVVGAVTELAVDYVAEISALVPEPSNDVRKTLAAEAMSSSRPAVVEDATTSEIIYPQTRKVAAKFGFHGSAAIPLLVDDQAIGVIIIFDGSVRTFTEDELSILTAFADQTSLALEKALLLSEAETERERADSMSSIHADVTKMRQGQESCNLSTDL
ncbi:MAG: hypothetical protein CL902_01715 [Dehalococcoidia bacterium]|nr:hypothetical protein [Dehalococcoidia bacterium]